MQYCLVTTLIVSFLLETQAVRHATTLMWTQKDDDGSVSIKGVSQPPEEWAYTGLPDIVGQATPFDAAVRIHSARIALGFNYASQKIFWSDRGFRQILRTQLQEQDETPYIYNSTVNRVYSGLSREVNGVAVDWLSGSIYWTDALYNWITVAQSVSYDLYKHLVTDNLDKPVGICVYPQKGYMYWSDMGRNPRIERSRLDGSQRVMLVSSDIEHPRGLALDIGREHLYWVDDFQDTINILELATMHRTQFAVPTGAPNQHNTLFGIAVFEDFIFITDQTYHHLKIFNRTHQTLIRNIPLTGLPYDVMMYDESLQEQSANDCSTLNCQHLCISVGQGQGKCICSEHYDLSPDGRTCTRDSSLSQPMFLYTIGNALCGSRIEIANRNEVHPADDVECFYNNVTRARALAVHVDAEEFFYSDTVERTINRVRMIGDWKKDTIAVQTGEVKGMCVDWLTYNLYWTDETLGHIYVSRTDGRFPLLLLDHLGSPRGIAVDPLKGWMYWTDAETSQIYKANMDGTKKEIFQHDMTTPEGVALDLVEGRVYWAEENGLKSVNEVGNDKKTLYSSLLSNFQGITVFQDYYAATNGESSVLYGPKSTGEAPRPIQHIDSVVSHDVIAYASYIQPTDNPGKCDGEDVLCDQLCLPKDSGHTCACAYGFELDTDGYSCISELTTTNFLLFVDPYQRQIYQLNLELSNANPQGIPIPTPEFPRMIDVDAIDKEVFWLDESARVIKKTGLKGGHEDIVVVVPEAHDITAFAVSSLTREILYSDGYRQSIFRNELNRGEERAFAGNSVATRMIIYEATGYVYWSEDVPAKAIYRQHLSHTDTILPVISSPETITGLALDRTANRVYWCTAKKIMHSALDGSGQKTLTNDNDDSFYYGLAVTPNYIYLSQWNDRVLYRRSHEDGPLNAVTHEFFSRISDIKDYSWISVDSNFTDEPGRLNSGTEQDTTLMVGIVAGVATLLLIVLITAILIWRVHRRKLPADEFHAQAHDNPTYATTTVIPEPDPVYHTLSGVTMRPASAGSRDSDLPDVVKLPFPEEEPAGGAVGTGLNESKKKKVPTATLR